MCKKILFYFSTPFRVAGGSLGGDGGGLQLIGKGWVVPATCLYHASAGTPVCKEPWALAYGGAASGLDVGGGGGCGVRAMG